MARASATETAFGELELAFPFCEALRGDLKTAIPARHRRWDPDDRVWRITGPSRETAVELLVAHFPGASIPDAYRRVAAVATEPPRPRPPRAVPPAPPDDGPAPVPILAVIACPTCRARHDQPVRAVAQTAAAVAKHERPPAEMVWVCPSCNALVVVGFAPALAAAS